MYFSSTNTNKRTIAEAVLMIRPVDFCFNSETAVDNEFQHEVEIPKSEVTSRALREFEGLVEKIRAAGVEVVVFDKSEHPELKDVITPDACFPNNWISTASNNLIYTYTMYADNRKTERKALPYIEKLLINKGYSFKGVIQVGSDFNDSRDGVLEGTGSIVFDHDNKVAYACRSRRTCEKAFQNFLELTNYKGVFFDSRSRAGAPFYHTNVIMCIGQKFIATCIESIAEEHRDMVVAQLKASGKEIIELTPEQIEENFCGNLLELKSKTTGENVVVMSEKAFKALTSEQKAKFEKYAKIIYSNIDTIEEISGGSTRCMQCEIFLKKDSDKVVGRSSAFNELVSPLSVTSITSQDLISPANLSNPLAFNNDEIVSPVQ